MTEQETQALLAAAIDAEAFIGVMFGNENGEVPETVQTPLGVPVKLREIFNSLKTATSNVCGLS